MAVAGLPVLLVCGGWCLLYAEDTPPGGWEQCVLRLESRRTGQVRPGRAAPKGASANKLSWTIRRDESPAGAAGCDRCANWDAMNRVSTGGVAWCAGAGVCYTRKTRRRVAGSNVFYGSRAAEPDRFGRVARHRKAQAPTNYHGQLDAMNRVSTK